MWQREAQSKLRWGKSSLFVLVCSRSSRLKPPQPWLGEVRPTGLEYDLICEKTWKYNSLLWSHKSSQHWSVPSSLRRVCEGPKSLNTKYTSCRSLTTAAAAIHNHKDRSIIHVLAQKDRRVRLCSSPASLACLCRGAARQINRCRWVSVKWHLSRRASIIEPNDSIFYRIVSINKKTRLQTTIDR